MQDENAEIIETKKAAEEARQQAGLQGVDIGRDLEGVAMRVMGREETLTGLGSFITTVVELADEA